MTSALSRAISSANPAALAIRDGRRALTYRDLQHRIVEEQIWLGAMEVKRCALHADNGSSWVISDLALMELQALNVPIPNSFTQAQFAHVIHDAAIESVLTDDMQRITAEHPEFTHIATSPGTGLALLQRSSRTAESVRSWTKVTYTSGSTGAAKGVCLTTDTLLTVARSLAAATAALGITKHMCVLPLPTLLENIAGVYAPLMLGAQIHVQPTASIGMSYGGLNIPLLLKEISLVAPDSLILVPELLRVLVLAVKNGWRAPDSLKLIAVGGGVVSTDLLDQAREARLPVYQGYGLSECTSVVCLNVPGSNKVGSVGKPLPHARVRIDATGQICVSGAIMSGYLGDATATPAEIQTGDLGEIDAEGFVYVSGRAKHLLITAMGRNIAPEWVESELTGERAIAQALVAGEGRPNLVALIVPAPGASLQMLVSAIDRANARLPDYARVRRWTLFPQTPSVSNGLLTANGRLRRSAIVATLAPIIDSLYLHEAANIHEFS